MFLLRYPQTLFASILNINFYQKLKDAKLKSVIMFFVISFLLLGTWLSGEIIIREAGSLQIEFEKTLDQFKDEHPELQDKLNKTPDIKQMLPFVIAPVYTGIAFLNTLLDAFLAYLIMSSFSKLKFTYILKVSLHLAVIAGIIDRVASAIYNQQGYPLFAISFWLLFIYVFSAASVSRTN